jgi:hypothetical protein
MFGSKRFDRKAALEQRAKLRAEGTSRIVKAQQEVEAARVALEESQRPLKRYEAAVRALEQENRAVDLQVGTIEVALRQDSAPLIDRARSMLYDRLQTVRGGVDQENAKDKGEATASLTRALLALEEVAVESADASKAIEKILAAIPQNDWRKFEPEFNRAPKRNEVVEEPLLIGGE